MYMYTIFFLILVVFNVRGISLRGAQSSHMGGQEVTTADEQLENVATQDDFKHDNEISEAEENPDEHYFQGDLLLTPEQMGKINHLLDVHSSKQSNQAYTRGLIKDLGRTWKNGVVYYTINKNVGGYKEKLIGEAIKHWEQRTCLRFIKRTNEEDYIDFVKSKSCASYVGRKGGKQLIMVGNRPGRCRLGNIIHEIGHSVGFFHEQSRPDRDRFIKILWRNIVDGRRFNFRKFPTSVIDSRDIGYDYKSIMHYSRRAFGKNHRRKLTILPTKDTHAHIGQRIALSKYDILQANELYGCDSDEISFPKI